MRAYPLTLMNMQKCALTLCFYTVNTFVAPLSALSCLYFAPRTPNHAQAALFAQGYTIPGKHLPLLYGPKPPPHFLIITSRSAQAMSIDMRADFASPGGSVCTGVYHPR